MARHLEAVYEQGILRPLEPLFLPEHQLVRLTLEEPAAPISWQSAKPVNERREEMQWLAKRSHPYAGQWVAIEGPVLVAHGAKLAEVRASAKAAGANDPLFARVPRNAVPDDTAPFAGW